jgi:protease II
MSPQRVKVPDPYRWLEADIHESPEVAEWAKKQNEIARKYLDAIPQRPAIEKRLTELWSYEGYSLPTQIGGKYFFFKNDGQLNQDILYVADSYKSEGRVLVDPKNRGLLVYPTRQRVFGTFYAAHPLRRHHPVAASIRSIKVAGSGTEAFALAPK